MLIIVEDGDIDGFLQSTLDIKTLGSLNVLKVDTAERRSHQLDRLYDLINALGIETNGNGIDACKTFEQDRLALHDGQTRARTYVTQPEHRGTVGHDRHEVPAIGIIVNLIEVLLDLETGSGNARGIGEHEIIAGRERHLADGCELAFIFLVELKGSFIDIRHEDNFLSAWYVTGFILIN